MSRFVVVLREDGHTVAFGPLSGSSARQWLTRFRDIRPTASVELVELVPVKRAPEVL